ncbi:hypothetical protein SLEP1_g5684 [Rubroshorea leprosula]|uniref:Reverse transcriptase zinc-binding domain-containing protein n=1 Tax=Rubroshorea leprosula TaxID=152421 RepID=A0AAV5I3H1_9ROSI|nr:hypothetical protein SLEP1_g5684 [Rubroshorea leprosula]
MSFVRPKHRTTSTILPRPNLATSLRSWDFSFMKALLRDRTRQHKKLSNKLINALLVVYALILTTTYQACPSPLKDQFLLERISKRDGGLGVKDLRLFNQALLGKWWGRLAKGSPGLLFNLIKEKYRYDGGNWCNWVKEGESARSNWWKDLCRLDVLEENKRGWLSEGFQIRISNGEKGFQIRIGKDNIIDEMGRWEDNKWVWNLPWRRTPHSWEQDSMQDFNKLLKETNLTIGKEDTWTWERDQLGDYSTSSRYTALVQHQPSPYRKVFEKIWNPLIPHKVYGFTWLLLLDRIPSKFNLLKRGLIKEMEAVKCSLCGRNVEDSNHLFLHCSVTAKIWSMCFEWWGFSIAIAGSCWDSFIQHESLATKSSERLGWIIVWFSLVWTIWTTRNEIIFRGKSMDLTKTFDQVQAQAFLWVKSKGNEVHFSDWILNPKCCKFL